MKLKRIMLPLILNFIIQITSAQTNLLSNLNPSYNQIISNEGIYYNGALYYINANSSYGSELWRSDGTVGGTYILKDIFIGSNGAFESEVLNAIVFQNKLYFVAKDSNYGFEIWVTDGSLKGTQLFLDLTKGISSSAIGSLVVVNNQILFELRSGFGTSLYTLNTITKSLTFLKSYEVIYSIFSMGNYAVFSGRLHGGILGTDLWRTNGTAIGTYILKDINPGLGNSFPSHFTKFGKLVMFDAFTDKNGYELWRSDGTSEGTHMITDIKTGTGDGLGGFYGPAIGASHNGYFYFGANDGLHGFELWRTKGIKGDAKRLTDINPLEKSSLQNPSEISSVGSKIIFKVYESKNCYSFDTVTLKIAISPFRNTYNNKLQFFNGIQYYPSQDSIYGDELKFNDGIKESLVQELTLNNNYQNPYLGSSFRILGKIKENIIFRYSDWQGVKFRSFNLINNTAFPPEIVRICWINDSRSDVIWNRIPEAVQYQIEYKAKNSTIWISKITSNSFIQLNSLIANNSYVYRIKSYVKNIGWGEWGEYRGFVQKQENAPNYASIISERSLTPQTQIIYWIKTPNTTKAHIRYRKINNLKWIDTISTTSPYVIIKGLNSNTFYEYEIKGYSGALSDNWRKHYFTTSIEEINSTYLEKKIFEDLNNKNSIWPNPCSNFQQSVKLKINIKNTKDHYRVLIVNPLGNLLENKNVRLLNGDNMFDLDINKLQNGLYFIKIVDYDGSVIFDKKLLIQ